VIPDTDVILEDPRWVDAVNAELLASQAAAALFSLDVATLATSAEMSVLFCSDARMRELNFRWMGKDAPTNVLSFPAPETQANAGARHLGDIALAFETIGTEAKAEGKAMSDHAMHLLIHGMLHLIGFDHQTDDEADHMEAIESRVMKSLGLNDPWASAQSRESRRV
jgi:probable rRNA maturation factor